MKFKFPKILLLLLLLLLGGGGFFASKIGIIDLDLLFCARSSFQYINKELACGGSLVVKKHAYAELKTKLEDFIQSKTNEKEVSEVSVYFRDLENGPTLGINEHANFAPASLLKVPLSLAYIGLSENEEPKLLQKKIHYIKSQRITEPLIPPANLIEENKTYSINELLERMIMYSDNRAYNLLLQFLNDNYPSSLQDTLESLGLIDPQNALEETLTVKSYASIFIQLYNASFLREKATSESVLALLSKTVFDKGITPGVPAGTKVAHKFGERASSNSQIKQLHDCGIVYYPKNPYLLCIMTRGQDFEKLSDIISAISKMVYEEFNYRKI